MPTCAPVLLKNSFHPFKFILQLYVKCDDGCLKIKSFSYIPLYALPSPAGNIMVGEMQVSSNNGLKKDWKTVIAVKLRQRQCKRVGDPSHEQSGHAVRGIDLKSF